MKKLTAFVLALACVWGLIGCSNQPAQAQSIKLLKEGNITDIDVTSLPEGYAYSFSGEDAKAIIDYLSNLNLEENFKENPDGYTGMTWVVSLKYDNGDVSTVYHFGNMFIKVENGPWYLMTYDEASRFGRLLSELND